MLPSAKDGATDAQKYHLLPVTEDSKIDIQFYQPRPWRVALRWFLICGLGLFCLSSVIMNLVLLTRPVHTIEKGSKWADLTYEVTAPIYSSTQYGPALSSQSELDRLWGAIDISDGIIAISDEEAKQWGLPLSERFPWDQSKGVYLLGAHHQIHCIKRIYEWISDVHQERAPTTAYMHIIHCLDNLLHDAWCHADDTPSMLLPPQPYRQKYPEFQTRQCKPWNKLTAWAKKYNACYQKENVTDASGLPTKDAFEHFKYCPEGSPYAPVMEKFFAQRAQGVDATEAYEASQENA